MKSNTMSLERKCKWMAFIKAIQIIDKKAVKIGLDPNNIDLPNVKIYKDYILPESETLEYHYELLAKDNSIGFFLLDN